MLITPQNVNVKLNSTNIKYYEDLGYIIPRIKNKSTNYRLCVKHGTVIIVSIDDLKKGSEEEVSVKCDYCGKIFPKIYYSYNNYKDIVDKDCCVDCKPLKIKESNNAKFGKDYNINTELLEKRSKKRRTNFEQIKEEFKNINFQLLISENEFINSKIPLPCICNNHPNIIQYKDRSSVSKGFGCKLCDNESRKSDGNSNWKGGITPLHNYLRGFILPWIIDSRKSCNNKCIITGKSSGIIHHLFGFTMILQELIKELELNIDFTKTKVEDLPEEQLRQIESKCLELHYKYGLGICLTTEIHKLYHSLYKYGNNTPSQFTEFKQRYNNGEFTSILSAK